MLDCLKGSADPDSKSFYKKVEPHSGNGIEFKISGFNAWKMFFSSKWLNGECLKLPIITYASDEAEPEENDPNGNGSAP